MAGMFRARHYIGKNHPSSYVLMKPSSSSLILARTFDWHGTGQHPCYSSVLCALPLGGCAQEKEGVLNAFTYRTKVKESRRFDPLQSLHGRRNKVERYLIMRREDTVEGSKFVWFPGGAIRSKVQISLGVREELRAQVQRYFVNIQRSFAS